LILALAVILAVLSYTKLNQDASNDLTVPHHITQMFQEWLVRYGKSYDRPEELLHRLRIFYENYRYVTERNLKNDGLVLGMTMFADLATDEFSPKSEFKQQMTEEELMAIKEQKTQKYSHENPQEDLNQGPVVDSVNWEQTDASKPLVLPQVGVQDVKCWGAVGAWANQYAITANHYITNKLKPPIIPVSAQWMLDCY
jgi:hypothetical protein